MKITEIKEMIQVRSDAVGFLHMSDIVKIEQILKKIDEDVITSLDKLSFNNICDKLLKIRNRKTQKNIDKIFDILFEENINFKEERYRYDSSTNSIYQFSKEKKAYIFIKNGDRAVLNKLIRENGRFI